MLILSQNPPVEAEPRMTCKPDLEHNGTYGICRTAPSTREPFFNRGGQGQKSSFINHITRITTY